MKKKWIIEVEWFGSNVSSDEPKLNLKQIIDAMNYPELKLFSLKVEQ